MRTVEDAAPASSTQRACLRCAERAELLGTEALNAQRDLEASLSRRGEWHVLLRGLQRGPYTLPALRQLLADREEGGAALVWRAGMLAWAPAQQLELLMDEPRTASTTVQRSRVFVVGAAPALSRRPAPSPQLTEGGSPPPAPSLTPPSFQEASVSTRPAARAPSRAAGETTLEFPAYRALSARAVWLRWMALASLVSIAAVGAYVTTLHRQTARERSAPYAAATQPREARRPPPPPPAPPAPNQAVSAPAASAAQVTPVSAPAALAAPRLAPAAAPKPPSDQAVVQRAVGHVRVRSGWAPVRASASADAQVLCSLSRGTQLEADAQLPGHRGRWFRVACDTHKRGWVHENHVRVRRR